MSITIQCKVHFSGARHGRKQMVVGVQPAVPLGHVPRLSRLMALAIRFDGLLQSREVADYADLARLGHVTRARVSQIMNLLNLAPDIQEQLLFLPAVTAGREPMKEWQVRPIAAVADWGRQREIWHQLLRVAAR
jgi:hypothetical protein